MFGLPPPHVVGPQAHPDPEFPTVTFPNPEEGRGTWALAFQEGAAHGARLVIGGCRWRGGGRGGKGCVFLFSSPSVMERVTGRCGGAPSVAYMQPSVASISIIDVPWRFLVLCVANDPDADRLAVAEACPSSPGGYHAFTGNEIGALLADWMWTNHKRRHPQVQ